MHVCGTHQDTLVKFGLEKMLTEVGIPSDKDRAAWSASPPPRR